MQYAQEQGWSTMLTTSRHFRKFLESHGNNALLEKVMVLCTVNKDICAWLAVSAKSMNFEGVSRIGNAIADIAKQNNGWELLCEVGDGKE